jgi:SAM-dependent methyltransferase
MRIVKYFKAVKLLYRSISHVVDIEEVRSLDQFLHSLPLERALNKTTVTLDLGCGGKPRNPFLANQLFGIDISVSQDENIRQADLSKSPIPFADSTMDFITAFDFIEHVPRVVYLPTIRYPFIELMNEIHRTLKTDGLFLSQTPIYPFSTCFTDPTHVNPITSETFSLYFDDTRKWGQIYGFKGAFQIKKSALHGTHLLSVMQKI